VTHGRLIDYRNGCRCEVCRAANIAYHREYRKRKRDGMKSTRHVPVFKVADHVERLLATGMSQTAIARIAGVSKGTVHRIHHRQMPRVWPRTADRIFGIELDAVPDTGLRPAWKTQRLLLELKRAGVPAANIAAALRLETDTTIKGLMGPVRVRKRTAERMRVLYQLAARQGIVPASVLEEVGA
jgi:transcriptional regulator with XRE-family HTH domain